MSHEITSKIQSEDFASILVGNYMLQNVLNTYSNVLVTRIDIEYSIVYFPLENMTTSIIYEIGYESIPKCYGLMSVSGCAHFEGPQIDNIPSSDLSGQDVLIGFVDTGIDYTNLAFQYEDHTTRIVSIWDQSIDRGSRYPVGFSYGTEFKREEINKALASEHPLTIVPSMDEIGHGTVLASIAGGSYDEINNFIGVAPKVEYVVVKLKPAKQYLRDFFCIPEGAISYQEDDIMLGINYLVQVAQQLNRPIVVCIGIGTAQGSYLGKGIFSSYLSRLGRLGRVAIVVAAGNEGNSDHHYYGVIPVASGINNVGLTVGNDESNFFVKFVGNAPNVFSVDLFAPTGEYVGHMPTYYIQRNTIEFKFKETTILADNTIEYILAGDQFIIFRFINPASGTWIFRIYGLSDMISTFNMGLPINNFISPRTYFINSDPLKTLVTPGTEQTVLTVVSYNTITESLYNYNSIGFSFEGATKPDIAAPGVDIWAPTIGNQYIWNTGTSVAAAHTTGKVAMLLEWGLVRENMNTMPSAIIRSMITNGARRLPDIIYPNPEWGFGILDIDNSILLARREKPSNGYL